MTNQTPTEPMQTSAIDQLSNRATTRHHGESFVDWICRSLDWHLAAEPDMERDRR
jgi:hypothetical protein